MDDTTGTATDPGLPADEQIVARLRNGDEAMFSQLVDAWSGGMLRAARAFVASLESAEDVVQDTWLAVVRGVDRFERRSSLRTWVYRIVVNRAKTRSVRESRTVPLSDLHDDTGPTVDPAWFQAPHEPYPGHWTRFPPPWPSVETQVEDRDMHHRVRAAMALLPPRQRAVIVLRDVAGYGSDEVCTVLEISAGNQRVLLHRARAAVRADLAEYLTADEGARR